jgi:hypothetical protein
MCAFRRLVLECSHKQKTTTITVNFPKINELHLNSSCQCIQLAMRQVNKQVKTSYSKEKNWELFALTLRFELTTFVSTSCVFTLCVIPARHHTLHAIYVNLLYTNMLFIATMIYDCINMHTIVHGQGYSSSRAYSSDTILTTHDSIDCGNQPGLFNCNAILQCNMAISRACL